MSPKKSRNIEIYISALVVKIFKKVNMRKNILMIILLSLIFVFTSCGNVAPIDSIEYTNAPITVEESTISKPDEPSSIIETEAPIVWHDPVKLGEKYTAKSINAKESAKLMGYQEGTYEFTYMKSLYLSVLFNHKI